MRFLNTTIPLYIGAHTLLILKLYVIALKLNMSEPKVAGHHFHPTK